MSDTCPPPSAPQSAPPSAPPPPDRIALVPVRADSPEARYALQCYYDELSARFGQTFAPPAADPDETWPPRGVFLVARGGDRVLGCGALRTDAPGVGEIKRVWIAPAARGMGLARRIMAALEDHARAMGLATLRLDTAAPLTEAITLYRRSGWTEIARYNDNPHASHWFEKAVARDTP
ncbi:GNAT family N-acetyltransferase [Frigidibacter oleivorans]|uniref:GNAT family N-acetyltransferase n=1 Tax=Frigidibacter oleivorans TaxID=2487129 RepID=UPI0013DF92E4|nr:GNAT family N-acetyltransferase [Frigidibacter oleivorans]